jgi:hypothetical protein
MIDVQAQRRKTHAERKYNIKIKNLKKQGMSWRQLKAIEDDFRRRYPWGRLR